MSIVVLPFPESILMPNRSRGKHWAVMQRAKKKAIRNSFFLTKEVGKINVENGLQITFFTPDKRRRDNDNLLSALKPSLDGFAQALGIDDTNFNPLIIRRVDGVGKALARVEIEGVSNE